MKQLMGELQLSTDTIRIYCDNQAAIAISKNPVQHSKTRHFKLAWHFIRQLQEEGEVEVHFVRTALQDADLLTKALPTTQHLSAEGRLGLLLDPS